MSSEDLRDSIRVDLRTLHCRSLNENNFKDIFPGIVSEVWMSFLEQVNDKSQLRNKLKIKDLEKGVNFIEEF